VEPAIRYTVRIPQPSAQLVSVELEARGVDGDAVLAMASWTPGSYLMREYARSVVHFDAADGERRALAWEKTDKNRWRVAAPADGTLRARWVLHAAELSVRTSHVDGTHAFLTGAATFPYLEGREEEPAEIAFDVPDSWQVTTALEAAGERAFRAASFDQLADSPFEIGTHRTIDWLIDDVPHRWAIWGRGNDDAKRLTQDTTRIVLAEKELFGSLPYPAFTFILHLLSGGTGGLEHRDCTVLAADRWSFQGREYESFLGLTAHELFHAWNGKRLRPAALGPFDYTRENYTRDLWVVEGITTYYTDLMLRRAGILSPARYLERLGEAISRYLATPGRRVQSLADASFDTWIKFYRPDANTPNATISYYQKGALVALLLDLELRVRSGNARSLDDVMRLLWERWGARDVGFPEGEVERVVSEVAGVDMAAFFDHAIRGTEELDLAGGLAAAGLVLGYRPAAPEGASPTRPVGDPSRERLANEARTGLQLRPEGGRVVVAHVQAGSAAWRAGVNPGDELVALDGFRVRDPAWLQARLLERPRGAELSLSVFRRDELLVLPVTVEHGPPQLFTVRRSPEPSEAQGALLDHWLRAVVTDEQVVDPLRLAMMRAGVDPDRGPG
jgi:predicted metalloprotease with PDZ domain